MRNAAGTSRSPSPGPRRSRSAPTSTEVGSCQLGPPRPSAPTTTVRGAPSSSSRSDRMSSSTSPPWISANRSSPVVVAGSCGTTVTTSSIGSSSGPSSTWIDPEKCSAAASMSSGDGSIVIVRSVVRSLGRVEEPALVRRSLGVGRVRGGGIGADDRVEVGLDVLVLDRFTHELVDRLQHAGVVPGVLVVFLILDRRRDGRDRHIGLVGDHDRIGFRRADRDVLLLRSARCGRRLVGFPVDVLDGREELVQVLEQIVASGLVVCH